MRARGGPSDVFSPQHTGAVLAGGLQSPNRTKALAPVLPAGAYLGIVQGGRSLEGGGTGSTAKRSRPAAEELNGREITVFDPPKRRKAKRGTARKGGPSHGIPGDILPDRSMLKAALR